MDLVAIGVLTRVGNVAFYGMASEPDSSRKVIEVVIESQSESQLALSGVQIFSMKYCLG
jgi:hypothetical protein